MRFVVILISLFFSGSATAQDWRSVASPFDLDRLDDHARTLKDAVAEARAGGTDADLAILDGLLADSRPIEGEALIGPWQCRTVKVGGLLPLTVYGWFNCVIDYGPEGLVFEKLSGSQRTSGQLWPIYPASGEGLPLRYIYLGAGHYGYETPRAYGGPGNSLGKDPANRDDPGVLESIGPGHARIGFPAPVLESRYDFLELRR